MAVYADRPTLAVAGQPGRRSAGAAGTQRPVSHRFLAPDRRGSACLVRLRSWRVFKNPLSLFIGGLTAVIMELAEPRVRSGVWEHTSFRQNPVQRLRRTG